MTELSAHGVSVTLPQGWEGRVFRRPAAGEVSTSGADGAAAPPGETTHTVLHVATIPLPPGLGDYGSAAVPDLGAADAFVMLVEFDPADATSPLFAGNRSVPRKLHGDDFSPKVMQRIVAGQAGSQIFCNEAGRAFCLYVVIGSYRNREQVVPMVNDVLGGIQISPAGARESGANAAETPTTMSPSTTAPTTTTPAPATPTTAPTTTTVPPDTPSTDPTAP
jgi:hypothetical protein